MHKTRLASSMRRQRGSAMMETVLVLPLVFVILGLVFFFGNAFQREQQQRILARYDVAQVANRATPTDSAPLNLDTQQQALNDLFFDNKADIESVDRDSYRSPAADQLAQWSYARSNPTGDLATNLFNHAPRGTKVKLLVDFTSTLNLPEAVSGPVLRRSVHPGPSWGYTDSITQAADGSWVYHLPSHQSYLRVEARLRDTFYDQFDQQLDQFTEPASRMVRLIRGTLYAYQPGYRGPTVNYTTR